MRGGYALSRGEHAPHCVGIAVPVISEAGGVVGSVSLTIRFFRVREEQVEMATRFLCGRAKEITQALRSRTIQASAAHA